MGNSITCFVPTESSTTRSTKTSQEVRAGGLFFRSVSKKQPATKTSQEDRAGGLFSRSASKQQPARKSFTKEQDAVIQEQALAAVMLLKQFHQKNNSDVSGPVPSFNRSTSVAYPPTAKTGTGRQGLTRSSTARQAPSSDLSSTLIPSDPNHQLAKQAVETGEVETRHFVLVHGGGFGAWCWYKTMTLLSETGFRVDAVDLTGSGVHSSDTNAVQSMEQYVKPLVDILKKLGDNEKVILVGHDFGGACVSYVMELYPSKIAKAVFVAAPMPKDGQSTLDVFSHQEGPTDLMRRAQVFLYGNGSGRPPTAIDHDKALLKDLFFNQSPAKDFVLSSVSMRPMPFGPVLEKLSLSEANYGSVSRFYIKTQEDYAIPVSFQEYMTDINPPEKVFNLKGSDHSPFFSKPQALHRILLEISHIPAKQG